MVKEKNQKKKQKGITLIALVITIIVLLILAGVTISALSGSNGILSNSVEAKKQTIIADVIEQAMIDILSEQANKKGADLPDDELTSILDKYGEIIGDEEELRDKILKTDNGGYDIPISDIIGNIQTGEGPTPSDTLRPGEVSTSTKKDNYSDGEKTATIPEGFKVSDKSEEEGRDLTKIDTGLVVIGPDDSEFVWVPVEINDMVMCKEHNKDAENAECNIVLTENDTKLICTVHGNSEDICGKLYATGIGEMFDSTLTTQTYTKDSGIREPDLVTNYDKDDNLNIVSNIEDEFKEMALSVAKYGGFYVSRYEMGLTSDNKPVSKNASVAANNVTTANASDSATRSWYGLYSKAKEYNTNENVSSSIKSSMIWGSQYDAMMLWMQENGIEVKNGANGTTTKPTEVAVRNTSTVTGQESNDILNNIFDIWGCHFEWTLEAYLTSTRGYRRRLLLS